MNNSKLTVFIGMAMTAISVNALAQAQTVYTNQPNEETRCGYDLIGTTRYPKCVYENKLNNIEAKCNKLSNFSLSITFTLRISESLFTTRGECIALYGTQTERKSIDYQDSKPELRWLLTDDGRTLSCTYNARNDTDFFKSLVSDRGITLKIESSVNERTFSQSMSRNNNFMTFLRECEKFVGYSGIRKDIGISWWKRW